jgi:hypothetical protein
MRQSIPTIRGTSLVVDHIVITSTANVIVAPK